MNADYDLSGTGTTRAEDDQGPPTQSHISPSILVYEDKVVTNAGCLAADAGPVGVVRAQGSHHQQDSQQCECKVTDSTSPSI